jgi:hypothetical protein
VRLGPSTQTQRPAQRDVPHAWDQLQQQFALLRIIPSWMMCQYQARWRNVAKSMISMGYRFQPTRHSTIVVEIHLTWDLRHPVWKPRIFDIQALAWPPVGLFLWRSDFECQVQSDSASFAE